MGRGSARLLLPSLGGEGGPRLGRGRAEFLPPFSQGRRWTATGVLSSRRGPDEGSLPEWPAANEEYPFILLRTPADKRSGGVSGALRGGPKTESGTRGSCSRLVTSLATCQCLRARLLVRLSAWGRAAQESTERMRLHRRLRKDTWYPFSLVPFLPGNIDVDFAFEFPTGRKMPWGHGGRPSWAPNRSGRIGPDVGARHGAPLRRGCAVGARFVEGCLTPHPFFPSKRWRQCGDRRRRGGSDPSPVSLRQVRAPAASHPLLQGEGNDTWGARQRLISPTFSKGEKVDRVWGAGGPNFSLPSPRGEGGPRQAFSPAVAGRMRGLFPSGPPPTHNIPSSSPTRSPIFEAGECRGHCEGAKNGKREAGLVLSTRHSALVTAFASGCWFA